jgi:hypothetical protein
MASVHVCCGMRQWPVINGKPYEQWMVSDAVDTSRLKLVGMRRYCTRPIVAYVTVRKYDGAYRAR